MTCPAAGCHIIGETESRSISHVLKTCPGRVGDIFFGGESKAAIFVVDRGFDGGNLGCNDRYKGSKNAANARNGKQHGEGCWTGEREKKGFVKSRSDVVYY